MGCLKRLFKRPQIQLMCPGTGVLLMNCPVGFGDCIKLQQAIFAFRLNIVGELGTCAFAINHAVNYGMHDMDTGFRAQWNVKSS
jgi:hypothetical protein